MTAPKNPILMGVIGAPHGVKGEIRIKSFTVDPLSLQNYGKLWTEDGRAFKIMRLRQQKNIVVAKLKGVNFRDEAEALNGTQLFVDRSALPSEDDENDFYVVDLIGLPAVNEAGDPIGKILSVQDFGAGDVLEIQEPDGKTWYIDFTKTNVPNVDIKAKTVTMSPPDIVSERDE